MQKTYRQTKYISFSTSPIIIFCFNIIKLCNRNVRFENSTRKADLTLNFVIRQLSVTLAPLPPSGTTIVL